MAGIVKVPIVQKRVKERLSEYRGVTLMLTICKVYNGAE